MLVTAPLRGEGGQLRPSALPTVLPLDLPAQDDEIAARVKQAVRLSAANDRCTPLWVSFE
jgi:hypothetical protein